MTAERQCIDCGAGIDHRHHMATRCFRCSQIHEKEQNRAKWQRQKERRVAGRILAASHYWCRPSVALAFPDPAFDGAPRCLRCGAPVPLPQYFCDVKVGAVCRRCADLEDDCSPDLVRAVVEIDMKRGETFHIGKHNRKESFYAG